VDPWGVMVERRSLVAGDGADRDEVAGMMAQFRYQPCHVLALFGAWTWHGKAATIAPPLL